MRILMETKQFATLMVVAFEGEGVHPTRGICFRPVEKSQSGDLVGFRAVAFNGDRELIVEPPFGYMDFSKSVFLGEDAFSLFSEMPGTSMKGESLLSLDFEVVDGKTMLVGVTTGFDSLLEESVAFENPVSVDLDVVSYDFAVNHLLNKYGPFVLARASLDSTPPVVLSMAAIRFIAKVEELLDVTFVYVGRAEGSPQYGTFVSKTAMLEIGGRNLPADEPFDVKNCLLFNELPEIQ